MGMRLQDMAMDREFKKANTVKGKETKKEVLNRLGLAPEKVVGAPKYVMINGVPNKIVNGKTIPMTKVTK
jgi:hypothetical protein